MKQCVNPDCTSYQEARQFPDQDIICPRCGEPLQISEVQVDPNLYRGANPYGAPVVQAARSNENLVAFLGAVATLALVFLLIWVLYQLGIIGQGRAVGAGTATPGNVGIAPALQTEQAIAQATRTVRPTPLGGLITGGGPVDVTPLPPLPTAAGQDGSSGGITSNPPASGGTRTLLCRRLDAGQPCDQVTSYGTRDGFYLAVESTFGQGAARTVRVRWYGPPNGEAALLNEDQTISPNREGRFWVGFSLTQSEPWTPGVYRADVFLDDGADRAAYAIWNVNP